MFVNSQSQFNDPDLSDKISEPDAILHPNIEAMTSNFVENGGDADELIKNLASGYVGTLHKINIMASIGKNHNIDIQKSLKEYMKQQLFKTFRPESFDSFVGDENSIPAWINQMLTSQYWCQIIIKLAHKTPNSKFLKYCFDRICKNTPEFINTLPPCYFTYDQFVPVMSYKIANLTSETLGEFLVIATRDARTILATAQMLNRNDHLPLINHIESYLSQKMPLLMLFQRTLLTLDGWNFEQVSSYFGKIPLTPEIIISYEALVERSYFSRDHVHKKLLSAVLAPSTKPEVIEQIIETLGKLSGDPIDKTYTEGVQILCKWKFNNLWEIKQALNVQKQRTLAEATLYAMHPKIKKNTIFTFSQTDIQPEIAIIKEITYWHPGLRSHAFSIFKQIFKSASEHLNEDQYRQINDSIYQSLLFFLQKDCGPRLLNFLSDKRTNISPDRLRMFVLKALQLIDPPISDDFLEAVVHFVASRNVRSLMFPGGSTAPLPSQQAGLQVLIRFVEKLNRAKVTKGHMREASILDDLHSRANKALLLAR